MESQNTIAGIVRAACSCCSEQKLLINHVQLGATRMYCPATKRTYLDRGDGVFRGDGQLLSAPAALATTPPPSITESDLLDDRPTRTQDKTRIQLERSTFA